MKSVNELVNTCEDLFSNERQAWLSTSMAGKLLGKKAAAAKSGEQGEGTEGEATKGD